MIAQLEAKYDAKFRSIVGSGSLGNGGKQHSFGLLHFNTSASTAAPSAEGPASAVQLQAKPPTKHSPAKDGKGSLRKKIISFFVEHALFTNFLILVPWIWMRKI